MSTFKLSTAQRNKPLLLCEGFCYTIDKITGDKIYWKCKFVRTLKGGYPLQHTLIFCQFVESEPKGLGLKYFAGWMLFGGVRKISKIEKMRFSSYFDVCDESSSYLASRSYEVLEKKHSSRKIVRWVHLYQVTYFPF